MGMVYFAHLLMVEILWSVIHFREEKQKWNLKNPTNKNGRVFFLFFDILGILICTSRRVRLVRYFSAKEGMQVRPLSPTLHASVAQW